MTPVILLFCYLLLYPANTISYENQIMHLPTLLDSWPSLEPLSCQTLLPTSLPGFIHMASLPRFLVSLPLMNALEEAGCRDQAKALQLRLSSQVGRKATQILSRHLQELQKGRSTVRGVSVDVLVSVLQLLARSKPGPERARRSLSTEDCNQEQEQNIHNIVQMLPGVGTYYNLATALYYASQNCSDKAKERGQDGAIDLGYDLLMTMAGLSGGPIGLWISAALKPAVKIGVHRLIQDYYEKEANSPQPETIKEGLGTSILDVSIVEETTTTAPLVSEVVTSASYWQWPYWEWA
ncbi:apolipoprotein F-like isoform X1 [Erinaceus europaeus]|uniref:Apolipoprotein F-like isoform X1 n=1 Tax=Erinaceus europaeus TaxID=9365 RepID=A0A1S3WPG1_ERIEU|nr:apolipoprotein F-like isoform X1 [Erinaceus europaeus]XP_016048177.2 apolipoprotein F-like isoform X1 [Erinaceus europaeus]